MNNNQTNIFDLPDMFNFPKNEENILKYWENINAFQTSLKKSEGKPKYFIFNNYLDSDILSRFTFYDGPPFATGLPHYGHILAGTIKVFFIMKIIII